MELPNDASLKFLVSRYAELKARYGEAIGTPELVLPTGKYFPDEFRGDAESVGGFFKRMLSYAPVSDELPVALRFLTPDHEPGATASGKSCGSGACSTKEGAPVREGVHEVDDGYLVEVHVADVATPTLLGATLARSTGAIVLAEAGDDSDDVGTMCEVAAIACGFGVLLANGSYVYAKGCGGVRVHQATRLGVEEHGVLLALFARDHGIKPAAVRAHLDTTPREAFDMGVAWVDSNPEITSALATRPEVLAAGLFTVEPIKGLIGRFFAKRRAQDENAIFEEALNER